MRSGVERLTYAIIIIVVVGEPLRAWLMALLLHLPPGSGAFHVRSHDIRRVLVFSFRGVFRIFDLNV